MRVMVTGGSGFIGSRLMERLIDEGHDAISYDLRLGPIGETVIGDVTDHEAFRFAVEVEGCDAVYHLAAAADLNWCSAHPNDAVRTNIEGTRVVSEECARLEIPLIFASTCCVYGNTPDIPSNEESILSPTDIYGATKVVAEELIRGYGRRGLRYRILRFGTTYGPGMRPTLAVHIFIMQALEDKPLTIHGSGEQTRCMIYIDDLIEACIRVLNLNINGTTINIATEEEISVNQMAQAILSLTGRPADQYVHVPDRPGQIMKEEIDISMARFLLGWEPRTFFDTGLEETLSWVEKTLDENR